ncbi:MULTISPECIES: GNAT family N-acetyltransferase [unclassified Streptomyces]|uniref:GNAT family N-acetyltransferase n=1 Tax=unclassified Streptomyces TaxID=2593676 RepID=UPI00210BCCA7|nr:GNAT family N-acetyltransferase [Streptomyces sp. DvalAA-14]
MTNDTTNHTTNHTANHTTNHTTDATADGTTDRTANAGPGSATASAPRPAGWSAAPHPVSAPESAALLRRYYTELIVRYYDRPTTDEEVTATLAELPSDDLARPTGEFLVGRRDGVPVGCVGLRVLDATTVEMTRMYVVPEARGQGVAALLIEAVEGLAVTAFGARLIRLDTRKDLVEARGLYAKQGYAEIESYNDNWLADHWFEKKLHRPG